MVAMVPIATLIVSLDSALRWLLGRLARSRIPNSVPPKTQAKTIPPTAQSFMLVLLFLSQDLDAVQQWSDDDRAAGIGQYRPSGGKPAWRISFLKYSSVHLTRRRAMG